MTLNGNRRIMKVNNSLIIISPHTLSEGASMPLQFHTNIHLLSNVYHHTIQAQHHLYVK